MFIKNDEEQDLERSFFIIEVLKGSVWSTHYLLTIA